MSFWLVAIAVFLLDQGTKYWILNHLEVWESVPLLPGWLHLTLVQNEGAAFGLFANWTWLFILVTLAAVLLVLFFYRRILALDWQFQLALALALGGAVGNLLDRIRFGHVVDFIDLLVWPVFNVADMAIIAGVVLLGYKILFLPPENESGVLPKQKTDN
jgi:signal peptidase II